MLILTVRTDKPEAEIGLFEDSRQLGYETWQAHRELGRTIHSTILGLLSSAAKDWQDLDGIVAYRGPGSFTGLRIGLTLANALADNLPCPIVGSSGDAWAQEGVERLLNGHDDRMVMPEYGAEANITTPKK